MRETIPVKLKKEYQGLLQWALDYHRLTYRIEARKRRLYEDSVMRQVLKKSR